jgi:hypothetical protein
VGKFVDDGIEIKGLVAVVAPLVLGPLTARVEIWAKWKSATFTRESLGARTVRTEKRRWLRKFDTTGPSPTEVPVAARPVRGCTVGLTRVTLPGNGVWWTFGFGAFGGLGTVEADLRAVAAGHPLDGLTAGLEASYPAWLRRAVAPRPENPPSE